MREWMREKFMRRRSKRGPNESESTGKIGQEIPANQPAPLRPSYPEPLTPSAATPPVEAKAPPPSPAPPPEPVAPAPVAQQQAEPAHSEPKLVHETQPES